MHTETTVVATDQKDAQPGARPSGLDRARVAKRRAELEAEGFNAAIWASKNNFKPNLVYEVMAGARACKRGHSHNIAVMLGFKDGVVSPVGGAA